MKLQINPGITLGHSLFARTNNVFRTKINVIPYDQYVCFLISLWNTGSVTINQNMIVIVVCYGLGNKPNLLDFSFSKQFTLQYIRMWQPVVLSLATLNDSLLLRYTFLQYYTHGKNTLWFCTVTKNKLKRQFDHVLHERLVISSVSKYTSQKRHLRIANMKIYYYITAPIDAK